MLKVTILNEKNEAIEERPVRGDIDDVLDDMRVYFDEQKKKGGKLSVHIKVESV